MLKKIILLCILLSGCKELLGIGNVMHAFVKGNTAGQVIGVTDIFIEKKTGKSVAKHIFDIVTEPNDIKTKSPKKKTKKIMEQFIEMEKNNQSSY